MAQLEASKVYSWHARFLAWLTQKYNEQEYQAEQLSVVPERTRS
jgi:hypothetical protein